MVTAAAPAIMTGANNCIAWEPLLLCGVSVWRVRHLAVVARLVVGRDGRSGAGTSVFLSVTTVTPGTGGLASYFGARALNSVGRSFFSSLVNARTSVSPSNL